jgi:hypothetical protein
MQQFHANATNNVSNKGIQALATSHWRAWHTQPTVGVTYAPQLAVVGAHE